MMTTSLRLAAVLTLAAAAMGCAESVESEDEAVGSDPSALLTLPTIPPPSCLPNTIMDGPTAHRRATAIWKWVTGGPTDPTNVYAKDHCATDADVANLKTRLTLLRTLLGNRIADPAHACQSAFSDVRVIQPYNVSATIFNVWCDGITAAQFDQLYTTVGFVNKVWPGVGAFWQREAFEKYLRADGTYSTSWMQLDPEPARLNGTLYYRSTAAATLTTTNASATAYQWSSGWAAGSMPVGAPCTTGSTTYIGTILYSTIQGYGTMRSCR
jgi:hypothetical protein